MKKRTLILALSLVKIAFLVIALSGCKKDDTTPTGITDVDGNVYHSVIIGTQTWLVENLKTTKFRNGDPITNTTDVTAWATQTSAAYCNYDNSTTNATTYGRLYNWFAVNDSRKIAPAGWHIPSDTEWATLFTYLGGESVASGKLKEAGLTHWITPNTGAANTIGFTALPGGGRSSVGVFANLGYYGFWWSSTEATTGNTGSGMNIYLHYGDAAAVRNSNFKVWGMAVRCVKD